MAELADTIQLDTASGLLYVDGTELPWAYVGGVPVVDDFQGENVPGITITLLGRSMEIISAQTAVLDGQD